MRKEGKMQAVIKRFTLRLTASNTKRSQRIGEFYLQCAKRK